MNNDRMNKCTELCNKLEENIWNIQRKIGQNNQNLTELNDMIIE